MRHLFIINPTAGKGNAGTRKAEEIRAYCAQAGLDHAVLFTECAGDAVRLTAGAAEAGTPLRVYACGGDGTLSEVVQGAAGLSHVAITNLPMGTGNDFLKLFGEGYREKFSDLAALSAGPQAAFDLIDCNGRLGLDIICAGVDARVAAGVDKYKALPLVRGAGAYILSLAENVLLKSLTQPMRVEMDGRTWDEPITLLCVCNGRYYGGGFMPVADAMPDDGVLDVLLVSQVKKTQFLRLVGAYAKGAYARFPDLIYPYHGAGPITLRADEPITAVVDGEVLQARELTFRLSDKKVNFFYPAGCSWRQEDRTANPKMAAIG